jgi:hypothetical protein
VIILRALRESLRITYQARSLFVPSLVSLPELPDLDLTNEVVKKDSSYDADPEDA